MNATPRRFWLAVFAIGYNLLYGYALTPPEARYALTAIRLGEKEGLIIRVGLPQWTQRLREPQIGQVTRNIIDLLRGQEPKIRTTR